MKATAQGYGSKPVTKVQMSFITRWQFMCYDCRRDTLRRDYYMLKETIWNLVAPRENFAMLCLSCAERRLGRELTKQDFKNCLLNKLPIKRSLKLRHRLGL